MDNENETILKSELEEFNRLPLNVELTVTELSYALKVIKTLMKWDDEQKLSSPTLMDALEPKKNKLLE